MLVVLTLSLALVSCNSAGDVPDGMKLASLTSSPYHLYIPESWQITQTIAACGGYTSDGSNVNVSVYAASDISVGGSEGTAVTTEDTSASTEVSTDSTVKTSREQYIDSYWEMCWKTYTKELNGFFVITDGKAAKLGGLDAKQYVYTAKFENVEYKMQMTVTYSAGLVYIFTYTAKTENYETHLEQIEKIVSAFKF